MLEISRADVIAERFQDFPHPFLKLSAENYLQLLDIDPLPSQIAIINAINNPKYRFICAALSRRQGKTYIANVIGQLVALIPGCNILIMSPNYSLSQISFDLQRRLIKHFDIEVTRDNSKDKVIELSNGSTVRMGSVNQVDSSVGRSYDLIIFDEAALTDGEEAFNVALRPTLDKDESKALFISTPRGRQNWFSRFYQRGSQEEYPAWISIKAQYMDNPRMSEEDVEEARRSMSKDEFAQEYLADFRTYEGQIYHFNYETCVHDLSHLDTSRMEVFAGMDMGARDPTSFVVIAYDWSTEDYYILDEFFAAELNTEQQAKRIQQMIQKYRVGQIFIDSAALQTRLDLAQLYDISTNKAKKSVIDGINYVASLIDNEKIKVDERCKEVLYCFDAYQWDPNPNLVQEKPKHDRRAVHTADALRYGIYSFNTGINIA